MLVLLIAGRTLSKYLLQVLFRLKDLLTHRAVAVPDTHRGRSNYNLSPSFYFLYRKVIKELYLRRLHSVFINYTQGSFQQHVIFNLGFLKRLTLEKPLSHMACFFHNNSCWHSAISFCVQKNHFYFCFCIVKTPKAGVLQRITSLDVK